MDIKDKRTSPVIDQPLELGPSNGDEIIVAGHHESETGSALPTLWLLWHRRGLLGRFALWGLIAATLFAFLIPKRYESTARLMPPDSDSAGKIAMLAAGSSGGGALGLGSLASSLLGGKNTNGVFIGILSSRTIQDRLVSQFDLRKVYWLSHWEDARKKLAKRTEISEDRKTGMISITVTDGDPERAKAMAQAYVDGLNKLVAELSTSSARRERIFLEGRLKGVQEDLYQSEKNFSEFSSKNSTLDLKEQGKAMLMAAADLEGQLIAAKAQLSGLGQIYTSSNVRVRSVQARINELQRQLEKLGGTKENVQEAPDAGDSDGMPYPSIRRLPLLGVTYTDLYRHIKVQETVFEVLTKQYELAKVEEAKEIPTVKLLDVPVVPEKKSFPPRVFMMVAGFLLSLALGAVYITGAEAWAQMAPAHPTKVFAQEVFSSVRESWLGKRVYHWRMGRRLQA